MPLGNCHRWIGGLLCTKSVHNGSSRLLFLGGYCVSASRPVTTFVSSLFRYIVNIHAVFFFSFIICIVLGLVIVALVGVSVSVVQFI